MQPACHAVESSSTGSFWPLVMTHDGSAWTRPQRRKHALIEEFVLGLAQHRSAHGAVNLMFRRSEDCENAM